MNIATGLDLVLGSADNRMLAKIKTAIICYNLRIQVLARSSGLGTRLFTLVTLVLRSGILLVPVYWGIHLIVREQSTFFGESEFLHLPLLVLLTTLMILMSVSMSLLAIYAETASAELWFMCCNVLYCESRFRG